MLYGPFKKKYSISYIHQVIRLSLNTDEFVNILKLQCEKTAFDAAVMNILHNCYDSLWNKLTLA